MKSDPVTIACYENSVPSFVEAELERLYGNIFSTLLQYRTYGVDIGRMNTYVVRAGGDVVGLYLFLRQQNRVVVLNEGIRLGGADLQRFCDYVFSKYGDVDVICFKAVETGVKAFAYPLQRVNYLEDLVLALPPTVEEYTGRLARHTYRNIRRYMERLRRDHPSFRFALYRNAELGESNIRAIIELNRARMARKNIVSAIDESETRHIIDIATACGAVGAITIDGRICAGAISYRTGDNYFLNVLAHDPRYDAYGLGLLCCFLTICECIRQGGREFHFLWGRYDYKFALLATQRDLDCVSVYRSHAHLLLNLKHAMRLAFHGGVRQAKLWVRHKNSFASQCALAALNLIRNARQAMRGAISMPMRMPLRNNEEQ